MDANRFDDVLRRLSEAPSRRGVARALAGFALSGATGSLIDPQGGEAKKRKKKKTCKNCGLCRKCKKGKCKPKPDGTDCGGGQTCRGGTCACPEGQDACGGACVASCPSVRLRNPVTCACCRPTGVHELVCDMDPCCSGLDCLLIGGEAGTFCPGRELGDPCSFDDQCESGICNANLVCA